MSIIKTTCIMCPLGCQLEIKKEKNGSIIVSGNTCNRGEIYAKEELTAPKRSFSSLVKLKSGQVVQVKTSGVIPKDKIFELTSELSKLKLDKKPPFGTIIIKNVLNLGVDVVTIDY